MTFKTRELTVDLVNEISTKEIRFSQGDRNSAKLVLNITNEGQELDLSQAKAVRITFKKPDGTTVFQEDLQPINAMKGKYQIILKTQTLAAAGNVYGQVRIFEKDQELDAEPFGFTVKQSYSGDGAVESTNEFTIIQKALELGEKFEGVEFDPIIAAGELAKGALPKTGGTMSGNIDMDISVGSKSKGYRWRDAAGALYGIESATDGSLILYDYKNLARVWQYDPVAKRFTVLSDTNLLKKTGDTMTGNLKFDRTTGQYRWVQWTTDGVIDYSLGVINTGKYILQDTKGNQTIFEYDPTTKKFNVNVDSNLVTKNKDGQVDLVVTADGEAFDSGTANVARRRGNTVTLRIALRRKVGSADTTVATIPADMRPSTFMVTNAIASDGTVSRLTVEANGNIRLATAGKDVYATITYVVD
ncbi:BppU family phage baseplate upper protein [Bacillus paranthracis]|uniref:BppU family phage baseplate upper protein n=1 Tax=Bacillus paranthracis TaxID=2026186 RepID=UPI00240E698D|nr:BppU family phage baseplate upper protein [Bacillus paranthracis]MDG1603629.1 BppU family phage baseplate upper protein [Bacillus paranthracis]